MSKTAGGEDIQRGVKLIAELEVTHPLSDKLRFINVLLNERQELMRKAISLGVLEGKENILRNRIVEIQIAVEKMLA